MNIYSPRLLEALKGYLGISERVPVVTAERSLTALRIHRFTVYILASLNRQTEALPWAEVDYWERIRLEETDSRHGWAAVCQAALDYLAAKEEYRELFADWLVQKQQRKAYNVLQLCSSESYYSQVESIQLFTTASGLEWDLTNYIQVKGITKAEYLRKDEPRLAIVEGEDSYFKETLKLREALPEFRTATGTLQSMVMDLWLPFNSKEHEEVERVRYYGLIQTLMHYCADESETTGEYVHGIYTKYFKPYLEQDYSEYFQVLLEREYVVQVTKFELTSVAGSAEPLESH